MPIDDRVKSIFCICFYQNAQIFILYQLKSKSQYFINWKGFSWPKKVKTTYGYHTLNSRAANLFHIWHFLLIPKPNRNKLCHMIEGVEIRKWEVIFENSSNRYTITAHFSKGKLTFDLEGLVPLHESARKFLVTFFYVIQTISATYPIRLKKMSFAVRITSTLINARFAIGIVWNR